MESDKMAQWNIQLEEQNRELHKRQAKQVFDDKVLGHFKAYVSEYTRRISKGND